MIIRLGKHSLLLLMPFFISFCSSSPQGVIILCAGDSITAEAYPHFLQQMFTREGRRAKILNYGRSGNTSGEYLSFLERRKERLKAELPDFILLELGTNDVRADLDHTPSDVFRDNMKKIIEIFKEFTNIQGKQSKLLLATIPPIPQNVSFPFTPESRLRVTEEINPIIHALCEEETLPLVDNYKLFLHEPLLLPNVHPSREGYRRLAQYWLESLRPFLNYPYPVP